MRSIFIIAKKNSQLLLRLCIALIVSVNFSACEVDDPEKEEVPELITTVKLTFVPDIGGKTVVASASDPDGEGVADMQIDEPIRLSSGTTYTLSIVLINGLADPTQPEYDVTEEVSEEADEHMFFFGWTVDLFTNPSGIGNADDPSGIVIYLDEDANGLPLGIETQWTTSTPATGEFRIILKHQPDLKSAQSDAHTGETDVDITFPFVIE